jgi:hypothetical protein
METMLLETEILIGDVVELSPTKMSTLDDFDLEKCTVLELDETDNRIKVVFNNDADVNETFFNNESTIDWFSTEHVIDIERDYKVIEITDNQDTITGQEVCVISMAKVIKQVVPTEDGCAIAAVADEQSIDKFIFIGFTAAELSVLDGTVNRISFAQYKIRDAEIDYVPIRGWQPKNIIEEPDDIFIMLNVG